MATVAKETKMEKVERILAETPDLPTAEIAARVGCDPGTVARAKARVAEKANEPVELGLESLDLDAGTQMRPAMDERREAEFADLMAEGVAFDPIEVYDVGGRLVPTDGFHRIAAAIRAEFETIRAVVRRGTLDDARRAAARANARGTLPRCPETCRNAVWAICGLDGPDRTPMYYAREAGVNAITAAKYVQQFRDANGLGPAETRIGRDGKEHPARKPKAAPEAPRGLSPDNPPGNGHVETYPPGDVPFDDEVLDDDAETVVIRPNIPAPAAKAEDREQKQAEEDRRWLENDLTREGKKPVRPRLSEACRRIFDRAALRYRRWSESPTCVEARKLLRSIIEDRKVSGDGDDPFSLAASAFLRIEHPRDWPICNICKGSGFADGHKCEKGKPDFGCGGCGFKLR
jgi:hypothetical protein